MSPRLPPEGDGELGAVDIPVDRLRISPEMRIPASTGSIFFKIPELTPENFCA
jgi:hypothetical protein